MCKCTWADSPINPDLVQVFRRGIVFVDFCSISGQKTQKSKKLNFWGIGNCRVSESCLDTAALEKINSMAKSEVSSVTLKIKKILLQLEIFFTSKYMVFHSFKEILEKICSHLCFFALNLLIQGQKSLEKKISRKMSISFWSKTSPVQGKNPARTSVLDSIFPVPVHQYKIESWDMKPFARPPHSFRNSDLQPNFAPCQLTFSFTEVGPPRFKVQDDRPDSGFQSLVFYSGSWINLTRIFQASKLIRRGEKVSCEF